MNSDWIKLERNTFMFILWFAIFFLVICNIHVKAADNSGSNKPRMIFHGAVSQNDLIDRLESVGIKGVVSENALSSSIKVVQVRLGSSAYHAGIKAGDKIQKLYELSANRFEISMERAGKMYQAKLQSIPEGLTPLHGSLSNRLLKSHANKDQIVGSISKDSLGTKAVIDKLSSQIDIKPKQDLLKKLVDYEIEVLIDISGSMKEIDGTGDLTKFQWCYEQLYEFARQLFVYRKTMTITKFHGVYETIKNCNPADIEEIYASTIPGGKTDLVDPLSDRLSAALENHYYYRDKSKPIVFVVITDGMPNISYSSMSVNEAIIEFTKQLKSPDESVITFLQIGDNFNGRDFCLDLDNNLIKQGAKYDIVDTETFAELKQYGLADAICRAVAEARNNANQSRGAKHYRLFLQTLPASNPIIKNLASDLKKKQTEREQLEKRILSNNQR